MRHFRITFMLLAILGLATVAGAQEFFDDFESYAADSEMHGQGGWWGWDNAAAAGAPLSSDYALSGSNSVEIGGGSDLVHEFDITGGRWEVAAMVYIPSGTTGESWFILLNEYAHGGTKDWSAQVAFNRSTDTLRSDESGDTAPMIYDTWVELRFLINLDDNTVDIYYNGEMFATHQWDNDNPGTGTFQCIDLWGNNVSAVYYDDISVSQYFIYTAHEPTPADGAVGVTAPLLRWTAGDTATFHDVYLGTSPDLTEADLVSPAQMFTMYYMAAGLEPGTTYYWRVDETTADMSTTYTGDLWSFTAVPLEAYAPMPWDQAKYVPTDTELMWSPGVDASTHDVYLGTDRDAVAARDAATFKGNVGAATYAPDALQEQTTYYWAIDEPDGAGGKVEGHVWSFTTLGPGGGVEAHYYNGMTPGGAPVLTQVEDTIDHTWGSGEVAAGLTDNVSARWTADLEAPLTETFTLITTSDDGVRLWLDGVLVIDNWTDHGTRDDTGKVDLVAGQVYSIRMEWYENGGGAVAQLSWESPTIAREIIPRGWLQLPRRATAPFPQNTATDVAHDLMMRWAPGGEAAQHDVYFGQDEETVANATPASAGVYRGRQALDNTAFDPGPLQWNTTYYWRVDEVNDAQPDSPWKGSVWSFTTAGFVVVDDFENYTNTVGQRVFEIWVDGVGFSLPEPGNPGNDTGMAVGHDVWNPGSPHYNGTIMETGNVAQGDQAMPLNYDNAASPFYSEAERTWAAPQDWTAEGVDTLSLWIKGKADNAADPVYVTITDSAGNAATIVNPDPAAATNANWTQWPVALSDVADAGVDMSAVKSMAIGTGNPAAPTPGGAGMLLVDDIRVMKAVAEQ